MKLTQIMNENQEEKRPLSNEVKKHFLEIVSTYNKYQEMMDRKSDLATVAETLGGITEAARTLAIHEGDDWFDKQTIKRNMSELDKLGKEFDKCATEANSLDQRLHGLYEDMGHILSRYYKIGDITEDQMKERLGMNESVGCGCGGTTESTCGCGTHTHESVNESASDVNKAMIPGDIKIKLQRALDVIDGKKLSYPQKLQVLGRVLDSMGIDKGELNKVSQKLRTKLESTVTEDGKMQGGADDPCWKGYEMVGMKKKDGKEVPNCVPKNESVVNEGMKPSQVRSAISKVKKELMRKWKQKGGYENFGQKELSQMKDKFDYNPYGSPDERQISKMLDGFNDWAMNYDGNMREDVSIVTEAKFGYKDSTASYMKNHKDEYKVAEKMNKGNEKKFYDDLQAMEDKLGHPKTMLFISNALRGYGVDMYKDPKIKNPQDAQEALFLLSK